jgi:hypothetical protein
MALSKSPELIRFEGALKSVLSVSKIDMQKMLEDERVANANKAKRGPKPKTLVSGHAASDKG